jgi:hypothetical protein
MEGVRDFELCDHCLKLFPDSNVVKHNEIVHATKSACAANPENQGAACGPRQRMVDFGKSSMTKMIRILSYIFLYAAIAFILFNWGAILYFDRFWKLVEILSLFDRINWIETVITLAPCILLVMWADKREKTRVSG